MKLKLLALGLVVIGGVGVMSVQEPAYGVADMGDWGAVTADSIEIVSTVWVDNTIYGIETDAIDLQYTIDMNGIEVANGTKDRLSLQEGNSTVELRTVLQREPLPAWWASHVRNGETTTMTASLSGSVSVMGRSVPVPSITYPKTFSTRLIDRLDHALNQTQGTYSRDLGLVQPRVQVTDARAEWGPVTEETTALDVYLTVRNPNSYPIPAPGFSGYLMMAQQKRAEWSSSTVQVLQQPADGIIPSGTSQEIGFRIDLDNRAVTDWLATHIRQGEQSEGEIRWWFAFDLEAGTLRIPATEAIGCPLSIRTSILVDDQQADVGYEGCHYMGQHTGSEGSGSTSDGSGSGSGDSLNGTLDGGSDGTSTDDGTDSSSDNTTDGSGDGLLGTLS